MRGPIPLPPLPAPPSWFPGHMLQFQRMLPALLNKTDVVLELRDARLPLTSINRNFEGALQKWRRERGKGILTEFSASNAVAPLDGSGFAPACERVVVFSKRDLVPEWGIKPFQRAMANKYPDQRTFFASWNRARDIKALNELLVNLAKEHPHRPELNVLVVGMPNVGKSTLLNALRNIGIAGPTPKALRTSAHPGMTRVLSTRLKLSVDPLVYAYDSPGVMLPFLGNGEKGAERGVKLALIAGIKEGLYDTETLASYLLYRLNVLDPVAPAYLRLLPPDSPPAVDIYDFLERLARRLCMLKRGGVPDLARAAVWFIKWWREEGGLASAVNAAAPGLSVSASDELSASTPGADPLSASILDADSLSASAPAPDAQNQNTPNMGPASPSQNANQTQRRGWGFDLEWDVAPSEAAAAARHDGALIQAKMEACMARFEAAAAQEEREGGAVSATQEKKRAKEAQRTRQQARSWARLAAKKGR